MNCFLALFLQGEEYELQAEQMRYYYCFWQIKLIARYTWRSKYT